VPLLLVAIAFVAIAILAIALMPVILVQRYRVGTRRQPARGWLLTINFIGIAISSVLFLVGAAFTGIWIPGALRYALVGMAIGGALGLAGLVLTRWESSPQGLFFTPFRPLVFFVVFVVSARILYGFWRTWQTWRSLGAADDWLVVAGVPQSMGAGALVVGYYLIYWAGVRRRQARHGRA
jgi:hypothetical protein